MSKVKRLRVFAGPNGSGKSTLFDEVAKQFNTGVFVNSDLIEKELSETGFINIERFKLLLTQKDWDIFCKTASAKSLIEKAQHQIDIYIRENVIVNKSRNTLSYAAALITTFIREKLLENNQSFSFETVMSHISKVNEIRSAKERGYKTYLYFVCLDDPELNLSRVQNRIEKGGHAVDTEKITSRYTRALENLLPAIKIADRAFLFDNSGKIMKLIAEANNQQLEILFAQKDLPNWFINYVINKL